MAVERKTPLDLTNMYATHEAFRRDLDRLVTAVEEGRAGSAGARAGWENFKKQLHIHHTVEDAELWPRVKRAVAGRPKDLALMAEMEAEHAELDPRLDAVDDALARGAAAGLPELVGALSTVLRDHMEHEEKSALPLIQEVLTAKDWDAFRGGMARAQGPRGAAVYVPWVCDGASDEDRDRFLAGMPAPVRLLNRAFWEAGYRKKGFWRR
ncbi:hemerythrin domain-containing protein [Streptomyces huiliensis]|uniref:hemerythrin domain-containing protein n=1 Tax=Streptomyces huiliensis TaxID=2876027 RepID=UPI001CBC05FB|nr:hemerythrin domain-containing protein [Streptomyces huiliensis]MBZ4322254.1 hemerythrin domain-containing protein [Streptomyces huiliensis]